MEKCEKTHILGHFWVIVPVQVELVPVQFRFWSFLANLYRYNLFCFSYFDQFSYFGHNLLISYPL